MLGFRIAVFFSRTFPMSILKPEPVSKAPTPPIPPVKVQKRVDAPRAGLRDKLCADCHRPFTMAEDQKHFLCPACHQRRQTRRPVRKGETRVLIQIKCVECGAQDYLDFVPPDPAKATCRACHLRLKREPKVEP